MSSKNDDFNDKIWSDIPALVIEKIYMYLNFNDKRSMSLVCKKWWKVALPELWKNFTLRLYNHSSTIETWPEVELANKYGSMFRHVDIISGGVSLGDASKNYIQLRMFLEALTESEGQLISFKMKFVDKILKYFTETEEINLLRCTMNFIKIQSNLENVSFENTEYRYEDGIELLTALCKNCDNLKTLELKSFININVDNYKILSDSNQIYKNLALKFLNLKKLAIDYSKLFENVFAKFEEMQCTTSSNKILSEIVVGCSHYEIIDYQGISPIAWKNLHKTCPELKVEVILLCSWFEIRNILEIYLVENMPVTKLSIVKYNLNQIDVEKILERIVSTKIVNHIRHIFICRLSQVDDISNSLIPFLSACPKLGNFSIEIMKPVKGFHSLFEYLLNNPSKNFKYLKIRISKITNMEYYKILKAFTDIYYPLFKKINLNVTLHTDREVISVNPPL